MRTSLCKLKPGMEFEVRGLRWSAGWEFDCPTAIIFPVFRFFEDGRSLEHALETVLIDGCIDGELKSTNPNDWDWRGWPAAYLRQKFYKPGVQRLVTRVRIIHDEDRELFWEEIPSQGRVPSWNLLALPEPDRIRILSGV